MAVQYTRVAQTLLIVGLILGVAAPVISAQTDTTQRINTIELTETGDATWSIETRTTLDSQTAVDEFQAYVTQVNSTATTQTTQRFTTQFQTVVAGANKSFDRNMSVTGLTVDADLLETATGTVGVTRILFTWQNYAATGHNTVTVGEVLSNGYTLSDSAVVKIVPPSGYEPASNPPAAAIDQSGTVEWTGPHAFSGLTLQFESTAEPPVTAPQNTTSSIVRVVVGAVGMLILIGVVFYWRLIRRSDGWSRTDLQTEDERVVSLLTAAEERVKQQRLEDEFDWSTAKVSRVTSSLEERGVLDKLTIGRENVLRLNDDDQTDD